MPAPSAPRRPFRTVGVSPATAWLLTHFRRSDPDGFDTFTATLARRHLEVEEQITFQDDLEELARAAGDWWDWKTFDVEPANPPVSNIARRSEHDEITTAAAAEALGVSPQHVGRLVRGGELVGRKVHDRSLMVTRASVEALRTRRAG